MTEKRQSHVMNPSCAIADRASVHRRKSILIFFRVFTVSKRVAILRRESPFFFSERVHTMAADIRRLIRAELIAIDQRRAALLKALAALTALADTDHRSTTNRRAKSTRRPRTYAPVRRKTYKTRDTRLRTALYDATVATVRGANEPLTKRAIRAALRSAGLPTASVDYHVQRAIGRRELRKTGDAFAAVG